MRVLISPDKFKGTLTAPAAALAIAEGIRAAQPSTAVSLCPVADGGEGTLGALLDGVGGSKLYFSSVDPWGQRCRVAVAALDDGSTCLESASSRSGDPLRADSHGLGVVISELVAEDPGARILIAVGGTASTDGGTGLARALGWRFLDRAGNELSPGGGALVELDRIVPPPIPVRMDVTGLCDVDAPLFGDTGSAYRFAAQKGATPEQVELLDRGLRRLSEVASTDVGIRLDDLAHAGAGGGIGAGIAAFCGGSLVSGFDRVAEAVRLRSRVQGADLVITGEGRFDEQSLQGKAAAGVARLSHEEGIPCLGLFGVLDVPMPIALKAGFSDVLTISSDAGTGATTDATARLAATAEMLMSRQPV